MAQLRHDAGARSRGDREREARPAADAGGQAPRDHWITAILTLGIVLRLLLALSNAQANDTHLPVIRIIAFEGRMPAWDEEWEAFQPKLYHLLVARLWRLTPDATPLFLTRVAQLVSCACGVATLLPVLRTLAQLRIERTARLLAFGLVALNPGLIGASAQATNDAMVILFCAVATWLGVRFFTSWSATDFVAMTASVVFAGIAKGNGLVMLVAIGMTLALTWAFPPADVRTPRRRTIASYFALFAITAVPSIAFIGPYATYQRTLGSPFVTNWRPSPRPALVRQGFVERPGLTSVVHGLLTFRFIDLLRTPASTSDRTQYPRHRTSLWTRVYAQNQSLRFERWPRSWRSDSPGVLQLTRLSFVLGLLPLAFLLAGAWSCARQVVTTWRVKACADDAPSPPLSSPSALLLLLLVAGGFAAFVALYSIRLRDYSSMKQLFVIPAVVSFAVFWGRGVMPMVGTAPPDAGLRRWRRHGVLAWMWLMLATHALDATLLVRHLRSHPQAPNTVWKSRRETSDPEAMRER